jgi:hypothetical protein
MVRMRSAYMLDIFGPKRDEVTGGWRKLHDEELRDLYSSPSIIRMFILVFCILLRFISIMGRRCSQRNKW